VADLERINGIGPSYQEIRVLQRKFEIMAEARTEETWTSEKMRSSQPTIGEYLSQNTSLIQRPGLDGSGAIPDKWMFVWQNDFLGSMPPEPPPKALERSLLFWSAV
jgi:hypothetical protein